MGILVMILVLIAVVFVPVMIGARLVGARNTGIGAAILAVIALTLIGVVCDRLFASTLIHFLATTALGGLVLSGILGTTFWRAIAVSFIAALIQIGVAMLFFGALVAAH